MMNNVLITKQTGPKGKEVKRIYIEEGCKIENYICSVRKPMEYYVLLDKDGKIIGSSFKDNKKKFTSKKF